eukprot:3132333-Rhodomonas_salina.2
MHVVTDAQLERSSSLRLGTEAADPSQRPRDLKKLQPQTQTAAAAPACLRATVLLCRLALPSTITQHASRQTWEEILSVMLAERVRTLLCLSVINRNSMTRARRGERRH